MPPSHPPPDDLIGQTIAGRYRIISRLGDGSIDVAYRAWDEEDGVPVVIKITKRFFLGDPKFAERFRLLQGLRHPHIVPIVDVGEHEGLPFVVMRFLPGGSLFSHRPKNGHGKVRTSPSGTLHLWLPAMAEALDFLHARGVVHSDIEPGNIFFDAQWNAFLDGFRITGNNFDSDFGSSWPVPIFISRPKVMYMAPEQFMPEQVLDGRTDQYALAVMVYEMLAGTRPFTGTTAHVAVEVMTQPVPRLDKKARGLPTSLVDAVHRGLAKCPGERFPTCREFAAAVLCDVEPLADDPGIARLLCPDCGNLLKLPVAAAGLCGLCPKCQAQMKVADDLSWLITADEAKRAMIPFPDRSEVEHFRHFKSFGPRDYGLSITNGNWAGSPRSGLTRVAIAAIIIGTIFLLLATQLFLWRASRNDPLGNEESLNNRRGVFGSVAHRS